MRLKKRRRIGASRGGGLGFFLPAEFRWTSERGCCGVTILGESPTFPTIGDNYFEKAAKATYLCHKPKTALY